MAAEYKKWPSRQDNLQVGDIVLFKIKDSCFASVWKIGKIDEVHEGRDGLVRGVDVSYKLVEPGKDNARHMVVQRPVKQIVKLFHISDTSLINDIAKVKKVTETITKRRNKVGTDDDSIDLTKVPDSKTDEVHPDVGETEDSKPTMKVREKGVDSGIKGEIIDEEETKMKTEVEKSDIKLENDSDGGDDCHKQVLDKKETNEYDEDNTDEENLHLETESQNDDTEATPTKIAFDTDKKKRKTEVEKLLIENDKFWRDFDERKKRGAADVSCSILFSDRQAEMFPGNLTDSTKYNLNYGVGVGLEEGAVSLL